MALTTSSTLDDAQAQYLANMDYRESGSASKALLLIEAARFLLLKTPKRSGTGPEFAEFNTDHLNRALSEAMSWRAANVGAAGGVFQADFSDYRGCE